MLQFFFILLMLALAWGVADHLQSLIGNAPPPAAPVKVEAQDAPAPAAVPATLTPAADQAAADDGGNASAATAGAEESAASSDGDGGKP